MAPRATTAAPPSPAPSAPAGSYKSAPRGALGLHSAQAGQEPAAQLRAPNEAGEAAAGEAQAHVCAKQVNKVQREEEKGKGSGDAQNQGAPKPSR